MTQSPRPQQPPAASPFAGGRRLLALALACGFLLTLGTVGYHLMKRDALAILDAVTGAPERDRAAAVLQWTLAQPGDEFHVGDGARTSQGSTAQFRLFNGARLSLKPDSQIRFRRPGGAGRLKVDVDLGAVDVMSGTGAMTVDSEFGDLVLDANTTLTMRRDGARLSVGVELGSITLSGRTVAAGEGVELELGGIIVDRPSTEAAATATPSVDTRPVEEPANEPLELGAGLPNAELVVTAGDTFVIHDPNPPTAVGFRFSELCPGPAILTSEGKSTQAREQANLSFGKGQHAYELSCLDTPKVVVARGHVRVLNDAGTRQLPTFAPTANVTTDGRRYTVLYQHRLPQVTVRWPTAPPAERYQLLVDGRNIETKAASHTFRSLKRGTHTVTFKADTEPPRQSRTTTVEVVYDTQAPAARVATPPQSFAEGESVTIEGQALPGWSVAVGGRELVVDAQQNFSVNYEGRGTVPIMFSHPTQGTHYYLRRPRSAP